MTLRTLVLGGTRSGKSAHAEGLLTSPDATYVATARRYPDDPDWDARIAGHVRSRPASWRTAEVPSGLPALLPSLTGPVIVDDLATWLTNVLDDANAWDGGAADAVEAECAALVDAVAAVTFRLVLVSAEVGLGVVPSTRSGRLFRDHLGSLNARLAEVCDEVTLVVAGIPLRLREAGGSR